jgi:ribose 5-phosphate isomerase B
LGERLIDKIINAFINTPFEGGRHERRVEKILQIEKGLTPKSATPAG